MAKSPAQIIQAKGGAVAFAAAVGVKDSLVRVWKHRDQFPRAHWPEIQVAYPDLDTEALLKAERAAQRKAAPGSERAA